MIVLVFMLDKNKELFSENENLMSESEGYI